MKMKTLKVLRRCIQIFLSWNLQTVIGYWNEAHGKFLGGRTLNSKISRRLGACFYLTDLERGYYK